MFYRIVVFVVKLVSHLLFYVHYEGLENIPKQGGYVLAANHRTNFDPIFIVLKVPGQVHYMAKEELFQNSLFALILRHLGAFPISRGKGDTGTLEIAANILRSGSPLGVFPEGTRHKDGVPGRPKSGAALLAATAGVGILPCSIDYGSALKFRTHVTIKYHPLLTSEQLKADPENSATIRAASRLMMDQIISGLTHLPQKEETV